VKTLRFGSVHKTPASRTGDAEGRRSKCSYAPSAPASSDSYRPVYTQGAETCRPWPIVHHPAGEVHSHSVPLAGALESAACGVDRPSKSSRLRMISRRGDASHERLKGCFASVKIPCYCLSADGREEQAHVRAVSHDKTGLASRLEFSFRQRVFQVLCRFRQ
jgi:hypothetical protein